MTCQHNVTGCNCLFTTSQTTATVYRFRTDDSHSSFSRFIRAVNRFKEEEARRAEFERMIRPGIVSSAPIIGRPLKPPVRPPVVIRRVFNTPAPHRRWRWKGHSGRPKRRLVG